MTRPAYPTVQGGCPVPSCPYMRRTCRTTLHRLHLAPASRGALLLVALLIGLPWLATALGTWWTGQP